MISDWMNLFRSSLHDPDLLFIPNQYPHFQIHQTGLSYREARMEVEFENQRFLDFKLLVSQGCACTSPCYSPLKMRQALADPVVFRGEGRDENRRIVLIGFLLGGWVAEAKRGSEPGGWGRVWQFTWPSRMWQDNCGDKPLLQWRNNMEIISLGNKPPTPHIRKHNLST